MHRRLLPVATTAVFFLLGAGAASAADVPETAAPMSASPAMSYFNWGGLHAGLQVGGLWGTASDGSIFVDNTSPAGGFAGGNIGYDFVVHNNWILGVEADANFSNASGSGSKTVPFPYSFEQKLDYFGTLRARIGYAVGSNLFYGTGGWAWGHGTRTVNFGPVPSDKRSLSGWTIGAGVEHEFTPNVIGRLQYLYTDYGTDNYNINFVPIPVHMTTSTLSLGINLKF